MNKSAANSSSRGQRVLDSMYRNRRRLATGCAILVAGLLGYFAVAGENGITVYKQKRAEDKLLGREIDALKQENDQLQKHVERLRSDPEEIELEARARFHYTKAGEVIYTLPDTPAAKPGTTPATPAAPSAPPHH